jgi:hypothetical protein
MGNALVVGLIERVGAELMAELQAEGGEMAARGDVEPVAS